MALVRDRLSCAKPFLAQDTAFLLIQVLHHQTQDIEVEIGPSLKPQRGLAA